MNDEMPVQFLTHQDRDFQEPGCLGLQPKAGSKLSSDFSLISQMTVDTIPFIQHDQFYKMKCNAIYPTLSSIEEKGISMQCNANCSLIVTSVVSRIHQVNIISNHSNRVFFSLFVFLK